MRNRLIPLTIFFAICPIAGLADEPAPTTESNLPARVRATLAGQAALEGTVQKLPGQAAFVAQHQGAKTPLAACSRVDFIPASNAPLPQALNYRLGWNTGESLTAEEIHIDDTTVAFQSPLGRLKLPRASLREVASNFEGAVYFKEPFSDQPKGFQLTGSPQLSSERANSRPSSLLLERPGQQLARKIEPPVAQGSFTVLFYDEGAVAPAGQWSVALYFGNAPEPDLRVHTGWDRTIYTVSLRSSLGIPALGIARRPGWHALRVTFGPQQLLVTIDDAALVSSLNKGVDRPLTRVMIEATGEATRETDTPARVWVDDLLLVDEFESVPSLLADPTQTALVDESGDQWLGTLLSANGRQAVMRLTGNLERTFEWRKVRSLRSPTVGPPTNGAWSGEVGEVALRSGGRLIVTLESADQKAWTVQHPLLGPLSLPVDQLESWRPLVNGRRQEIVQGPWRLGARLVPEFSRPMPDGTTLKAEFNLERPTDNVRLRLAVLGMEGIGPAARFAPLLREGSLRSEVWLNGKNVDYLNRHLIDRPTLATELSVSLPRSALQAGKNVLELRQRPDPSTGYYDEAEVSHLAIEEIQQDSK